MDTGEALPETLFQKMLEAKNFQSAMGLVRQLEFSLFDFRIHHEYSKDQADWIEKVLAEVREQISVVPLVDYNRFANSFSHIFAGGYAAGYYSYKWAEVLSCDAFSRFKEEGIFNQEVGRAFLQRILQVGSSVKAMDAFISFMGREPKMDAFLLSNGISSKPC